MSQFKVVVGPPVLAVPSTPGQADGEVDVTLRFENIAHADEAVAILGNLTQVNAGTIAGAFGMALAMYGDAQRLKSL